MSWKSTLPSPVPLYTCLDSFLSSLRTNLQISNFEDSHVTTFAGALHPTLDTYDLPKSPYLNDLAFSSGFADDLEDPPSPTSTSTSTISTPQSVFAPATWTYQASTNDDQSEALKLIADSIVEQRSIAIRGILLHPAVLAMASLLTLLLLRSAYHEPHKNGPVAGIIGTFAVMVALIAIHHTTKAYLTWASAVEDPAWLQDGLYRRSQYNNGSAGGSKQHIHHGSIPAEDEIIIATHQGSIVGVLVLRTARTNALSSGAPSANGMRALRHRHSNSSSSGRLTGVIRAWTVHPSHRHRGFGSSLLESAVSICRLRRLDGPIFADEHLHSAHIPGLRLLPWPFNRIFERREEQAKESLKAAIEGKERKR
ncbi:hypothetical protein BGW36DRAFT_285046 [Talaromyces proteolyticus]|uniref:N-acetyltransferase domain-containing protein n=1 Tax=Talaromyces proteolyticus TaxID=1131652 RepID=A0AAD4L057_9EURO|nr:uncharacterized protein BGW36DRAFT_285046 [Talaromyces proteolyticus]KAH8705123.1 hypothetical protein BGW36DRAFT_285046 [Talaromyces proteolyticus]